MSRTIVIVGGGMTADSAARGVREIDPDAHVLVLGAEPSPPVARPALSKKLWTDPDFSLQDADLGTSGEEGIEVRTGTEVVSIDVEARSVSTSDGEQVTYDELLLATGGTPRTIEGIEDAGRVLYYRTLADYHRLVELVRRRPQVVVVGGGYIGTEIAAALVQQDCTVTLVHPDGTLNEKTFPAELAERFEKLFTDAGVQVRGGLKVERGRTTGDSVELDLDDGSTLTADVVVVGLGVEPTTALAAAAGLEQSDDGGIVVDERLRTSAEHVYAAGDVAHYPDVRLGRTRIEHVDNATRMGTVAGHVLAGADERYDHTPFFYSAVLGTRYEAVGTLDAGLETDVSPREDGSTMVRYLDEGRTVGVLMWDVEEGGDAHEVARRTIDASGTEDD